MNRREFLSATAATVAAGTLVPPLFSAEPVQKAEGMNYAPRGKPNPVVKPGEFTIAAIRLDHGHINGMCNGLLEAGATLKWVFDPDPKKTDAFRAQFPQARVARSLDEVLGDPAVRLVACAAVPSERGPIGCTGDGGRQGLLHRQGPLHHPRPAGAGQEGRGRGPAANTWSITASACTTSPPCSRPISWRRAPSAA